MPSIAHVAGAESTAAEVVSDILNRDGAVVVEGALEPGMVAALNADFDRFSEDLGVGVRHPSSEFFVDFFGASTVRFDGLPAKSPAFLEFVQLPLLQEVADILLKPNCEDYLPNTAQVIEIRPGETAQPLHRDEDAWNPMPKVEVLLQVEAMFALSDFTKASGAPRSFPATTFGKPTASRSRRRSFKPRCWRVRRCSIWDLRFMAAAQTRPRMCAVVDCFWVTSSAGSGPRRACF